MRTPIFCSHLRSSDTRPSIFQPVHVLWLGLALLLPLRALAVPTPDAEHHNPSMAIMDSENANTVNAVLGDMSWELAFGGTPSAKAPEQLRIQTHLAFVEALLRAVDTRHWPEVLRDKRAVQLDRLRDYRQAGVFPSNTEFDGRRPIFIDAEGRLCAVGYLMAEDAGLELAQSVDARYHAGYVLDMEAAEVQDWVAQSGLTAEECAMIQPAYGPPITEETGTLTDTYLYSTGAWTMANGALAGINGSAFVRGESGLIMGIVGLASGLGQIGYGVAKVPVEEYDCFGWGPCPVDNEAPAAWTNIGAGSLASIAAILRLTRGRAKGTAGLQAIPDAVTVPNPEGDGIALRWQYRF